MDKQVLLDYIDACELIRETEADIRKLRQRKGVVLQDAVRGSNPEWPYEARSFRIEGLAEHVSDKWMLEEEERVLTERKVDAEHLKLQVEEWMGGIPMRMQRIIRYKLFEGMKWEEVAEKLGRKATGESARKEFEKFMKEN